MATYQAPLRDMQFVLHELLGAEREFAALPGYEEATRDLIDPVLEEAAKLCENVMFPLNRTGDQEGCTFEDGEVRTPTGFRDAYRAYVEGGWGGLTCNPEFGGQGLPHTLSVFVEEMLQSSNMALALYPGLTHGACIALDKHGTDDLRRRYLPKLVDGTWSGVMCLTESHCGTDLGLLRTRAEPTGDGRYRVDRHQDLHHRRRAGSEREHRPLRPRPAVGCAPGREGHQHVPRAQVPGRGGRLAGRAKRRQLRLHRAQDGDQGREHLRDELRRRDRLSRSASRTAGCARCSR